MPGQLLHQISRKIGSHTRWRGTKVSPGHVIGNQLEPNSVKFNIAIPSSTQCGSRRYFRPPLGSILFYKIPGVLAANSAIRRSDRGHICVSTPARPTIRSRLQHPKNPSNSSKTLHLRHHGSQKMTTTKFRSSTVQLGQRFPHQKVKIQESMNEAFDKDETISSISIDILSDAKNCEIPS